jgi:membrane protein
MLKGIGWLVSVLAHSLKKFYWDDCFSRASSLAYTTLFALVPVSTLAFSMFSAFRIDQEQVTHAITTLLTQFLPPIENEQLKELRDQILSYLTLFTDNVSALNTLSVAVLFFTAVALLNTIESALNAVWRVTSGLSLVNKLTNFWAVMTLGPLLLSISFIWYAKFNVLTKDSPWIQSNLFPVMDFLVPLTATWVALSLLYYKLPSARVRFGDAALGGLFAAMLFEFSKRLFAQYISLSTTYSAIYGVLTSIPIFLFWLYVVWLVVLLGAEIAYHSGNFSLLSGIRKYATDMGDVGALLGIRVLYSITKSFYDGKQPPTESNLALETGCDPVRLKSCLDLLTSGGLLTVADPITHSRGLALDPEKICVREVFDRFVDSSADANEVDQPNRFHLIDAIRGAATGPAGGVETSDWSLKDLVQSARVLPDKVTYRA